jgi:uncharacterized protein YcbK (DUF882 family)
MTKNFSEKEVIDWAKFQGITGNDLQLLNKWIEEEFNNEVKANAKLIAVELQAIRGNVNSAFSSYNDKIGIRCVSWFRPKKWELHRKRSGASQHITGHGVDFIITGVTPSDYPVIMEWIWNELNKGTGFNGGLARLYKNNRWSFIHIDLGRKRRWEY